MTRLVIHNRVRDDGEGTRTSVSQPWTDDIGGLVESIREGIRNQTGDGYKANFWTNMPDIYQNSLQTGSSVLWRGLPARVISIVRAERGGMQGWEVFVDVTSP